MDPAIIYIAPTSIDHLDSLPNGIVATPARIKNRYGNNYNLKLRVPKNTQTNSNSEIAKRTYAIILSGGISPISNYGRYWNDCSYIYQTLTNKYGIPKGNIVPIMADGNDPDADSYDYGIGKFVSSSLDLDFDGQDELEYAATKKNVINEINKMASKVTSEDQFFLFVIDHGGTNDYISKSYICLWNSEKLYDTELATLLDQFNARSINVVLGQCFSGGFIDNLEKSGRVIATACSGSESSYACSNIPYDEFVFHWTNAINERNRHTGGTVFSDPDNNDRITMEEAFNYAQANDLKKETPMYSSIPKSVGEDLAFNNIPLDVDLYMRDNIEDTGKEPNLTAPEYWNSPNIWIRNTDDGFEHQESEPIKINSLKQLVYVYYRITNRGIKDYNGNGKYIQAYWANTAFGQDADAWLGISNPMTETKYGNELHQSGIGINTKAGESKILEMPTILYDEITKEALETGKNLHICILARIKDTYWDSPLITIDSLKKIIDKKSQSKKIVQKNLTIINDNDISTNNVPVLVRNMTSNTANYDIVVLPDKNSTTSVFDKIEVSMQLSNPILNAWKAGGMKGSNLSYSTANPQVIRLLNTDSKLNNLKLTGSQVDDVLFTCRVLANTAVTQNDTLRLHVAQADENGNYVGGEAFEVRITPRPAMAPTASYKIDNGNYTLTAGNVHENAKYEWYDASNNLVGHGNNISLPIGKFGQYKLRVISNKDGAVSYANINISNALNIKSAAFNSSNKNDVAVELSMPATDKTRLKITSVANPMFNKEIKINKTETKAVAEIRNCPKGVYVVSLEENGVTMDTKRIVNE